MLTRITSVLGIANAGRALAFALALAALAAVAGFVAGKQWQVGVEARTDLKELNEALDAQLEQLELLRGVAKEFADAREQQRVFHLGQQRRLLDWLVAPSLADDCGIGPAGLQLWNDANAGPAGGAAAPGPVVAVPAPAAGGGRPREDAGGESRRGDATAGRLRDPPRRNRGVGADRDGPNH